MKSTSILLVVSILLAGCGSGESMNQAEAQSFAPPKGQPRSEKANQDIADFKKRFEEKHGAATNAPANIQPPASNTGG